ncbi:MAG TPA: Ppx/GppA phosphatase family protein [Acidimicrobiales bacterium]|jgi:exopolyphosphatase / guanosine-5'-triphosphate,3'-diphosphate pyrophosphatase|nr:Ppx/GppA phosphatase family protein [Acidimicrobiales bacterium]
MENGSAPLAAIDIGTNSIHLVIARPTGNNRFEVVDREKEVVRLGSGSGDMKRLAPEAIERGIDTLGRFRRLVDSHGAELHAVATSAVREAENRSEFVRRARDEAGVPVSVISGAEEARLIRLGVLQAVPAYDQRHLLVDIGGGSSEFVVGEGNEVLGARSLKLGAIRLTERFGLDRPVRRKTLEECRQFIRSYLTQVTRMVRPLGFDIAIGSSGTIVNVAEMVRAARGEAPMLQVSGAVIDAGGLRDVVKALLDADSVEERLQVPGLDARRADIVLGGALVLEQTFAALAIDEMIASDFALREGVLLDVLRRRDKTSLGHLRDLRYESVTHLAAIAPGELEHAQHATELALELFEQTADLHGLDPSCEEMLEAAGLLANVGLFVSHDRHHLHSYYVIRNSDVLTGFTDDEIELIAQVARYHRKSAPKPSHVEFAALPGAVQSKVRTLAGILRIGVALDRTRTGAVRELLATHRKGTLTITLRHDDDADVSLEAYTAVTRKGLLEDALDVEVVIDVGT